jgi:hypothetical protein
MNLGTASGRRLLLSKASLIGLDIGFSGIPEEFLFKICTCFVLAKVSAFNSSVKENLWARKGK